VWHVVAFALIVGSRLPFDFDIDWIEGTSLYQAHRLLTHQPLYTNAATSGFLPCPYPPLYFAVVALVAKLSGGVSYAAGRGVSAFSLVLALATMALALYRHVRRRGVDALVAGVLALGAAALALSSNTTIGAFYDIARPDSLQAAFILGATVVATGMRESSTWRSATVGALGMALALYTKQTSIFAAVALGVGLALERRSLAVTYFAALLVVGGVAFVWLQQATSGSFATWLFATRRHLIIWAKVPEGGERAVVWLPYLALAAVAAIAFWRWLTPRARTWLLVALASVPPALLGYAKAWGFVNNFVPLLVVAAPAATIVFADLVTAREETAKLRTTMLVLAQANILLARMYVGDFFRPRSQTREVARALVRDVAELPGDVLCPINPFLPVLAKHSDGQAPLLTYLDASHSEVFGVVADGYPAYVAKRKPRWILLTEHDEERGLRGLLGADYVFRRELPSPAMGEVVLLFASPNHLYERRPEAMTHPETARR
jgi:hypothetical protein